MDKIKLLLILFTFFSSIIFAQSDNGTIDSLALWPEIEPLKIDYLKVSDLHQIYYELSGNPKGIPVFVIHGGPGASSEPKMRRFFNPVKYFIVLHDQRGAGKSKPFAEIRENTTKDLVEDIERLRKYLKLDSIIIFGGSWGTTLGLAYAETYPEKVKAIILRSVYLATKEEDDHYYFHVQKFFPEAYEQYIKALPDSAIPPTPDKLIKLVMSKSKSEREKYSKIILKYEEKFLSLYVPDKELDDYYNSESNINEIYQEALIENHYFSNQCFLKENQLIQNAYKLKGIPTFIVNGRYDIADPPIYAYRLHKALPESKLIITEATGHSMYEENTQRELVRIMKMLEKP